MINVVDLQETIEELQAQMLTRSLEEGRNLLTGVGNGNSLAEELEAMSAQEVGSYHLHDSSSTLQKDRCLRISSHSLMMLVCVTVMHGANSVCIYLVVSGPLRRFKGVNMIKNPVQFSLLESNLRTVPLLRWKRDDACYTFSSVASQ